MFLGYANDSKAYRVYNKRTLSVEESVHIIFDETDYSVQRDVDILQETEDFEIGLVRRDPNEEVPTSNKQQARVQEETVPHRNHDEPVPEEFAEEVPTETEDVGNTHEVETEVNINEAENARNTPVAKSVRGETSER